MKNHIKQQQQHDRNKKQQTPTKPQENQEPDTKANKIKTMLSKQTLTIGFAPITNEQLQTVERKMIERGVMTDSQSWEDKKITIKSVIKSWAYKNFKITETEWDTINVEEIHQTISDNSDIVFLRCKTQQDTQKITSRSRNLPNDETGNGHRLVNFIDSRAKARYRGFQQIAKTLREESSVPIQTKIRTGRTDFLLRVREKRDPTPWSQVAPLKIKQTIPNFEVGLFKDIFNLSLSSSSESESDMEQEEKEQERRI